MTKQKKRQTYPKDNSENEREANKKLRSQVRRLQKEVRELKSENKTLLEAWAKTESFLQEITKGEPLEEIMKYNKLPSKITRIKEQKVDKINEEEERELARQKLAQWRKDNL